MDAPTPTGGQPAGVPASDPWTAGVDPDALEAQADSLMDAIVARDQREFDPISAERRPQPQQQPPQGQQPQAKPEGEQQPEAQAKPEGETKPEGEQKPEEAKPEEEGKTYESLDQYLSEQKLDRDSFMELPVTVKVDGKDMQVSLGELTKGYELKQASYDRMQQAARAREEFTTEQTQVRGALGVQIQRTEALLKAAQEQLMGDYAQVTPQVLAELRAKDPGQYAAIVADYNQRVGAIQNLMTQVDQARQANAQAAAQAQRAIIPRELAKLAEARPEWRDPAKAQAAQKAMNDLGRRLGFTDAELNGIYDHRYMLVLDMAARFAQLQASQSATLTRVRSAPRMAKPGTRTTADPQQSAYQQAQEALRRNPDDTDAQARVAEFLVG